jgi:hypothetical protein
MIYSFIYEKKYARPNVQPVLYVVRTMSENGILFSKTKEVLEGGSLAAFKPEFLTGLQNKLAELFDIDIPFKASEVEKNYEYSIYTTLF